MNALIEGGLRCRRGAPVATAGHALHVAPGAEGPFSPGHDNDANAGAFFAVGQHFSKGLIHGARHSIPGLGSVQGDVENALALPGLQILRSRIEMVLVISFASPRKSQASAYPGLGADTTALGALAQGAYAQAST